MLTFDIEEERYRSMMVEEKYACVTVRSEPFRRSGSILNRLSAIYFTVIGKPGPFARFGSSGFKRPAQPKNRIQNLAFSELDPYYDLAGAGTETADEGPLL